MLSYDPCASYQLAGTPRSNQSHRPTMSAHTLPMLQRPHALVIGADSAHQRPVLRARGFTFSHTLSLVAGYAQALHRLALAETPRPLMIVLDLQTSELNFPELTAPILAAALAHQMQLGTIHPAWLIGFSADLTPHIETEARTAGFHQILRAPITDEEAQTLRRLVAQPAPLAHNEAPPELLGPILAYQLAAQRVVEIVRGAQIEFWTEEDARALLGWLTHYPVSRQEAQLRSPNAHLRRLLRALGGENGARARLHTIAQEWQTRYPLRGAILDLFLGGYERKEIVKSFVEQDLYEDSRIYACIKELPQRLAVQLRVEQIAIGDDLEDD